MSWLRTLLRVIAWIFLIGPNLPGPPSANPGRPAPPSITEPSLLDSILDLLPAPIRLLYPPPYVEPLSFTLTSSAAWLCFPSLSSHGHCPTPDRSRLSASKEYVVRNASSLAERASAAVWLATPHALFGSKPGFAPDLVGAEGASHMGLRSTQEPFLMSPDDSRDINFKLISNASLFVHHRSGTLRSQIRPKLTSN
ncbi:hypothetical protein BDV93DRAFT_510699 [Ceratobasidium sp. AG-I]|nr:hypothetical protein BDV93DRAFT_510699 [Ceratobasidium sp. AG-I]